MTLTRPTGTGLIRPTGTGLIRPTNVGLVRTASGIVTTSYQATVLADAPKGYWKLDDTSGVVAVDTTASANNGTYVSAPTLNQTPLITAGKSVLFTAGSSQYASTPALAGYAATTALSIECWVKTAVAGASQFFVASMNSSPNNRYALRLNASGVCEFFIWDNADAPWSWAGSVVVNDNATHHIVGTYDGVTVKLYVDGALDGVGLPKVVTLATGTNGPFIACRNTGSIPQNFVTATIDEVAFYTTTLSAARVAAHNTAGRS